MTSPSCIWTSPPRPLTEAVGDGWYLRLVAGQVAGVEIHGLRRVLGLEPGLADVISSALAEEPATSELGQDFAITGLANQYPATARALWVLLGVAVEKYRQMEHAEAGA